MPAGGICALGPVQPARTRSRLAAGAGRAVGHLDRVSLGADPHRVRAARVEAAARAAGRPGPAARPGWSAARSCDSEIVERSSSRVYGCAGLAKTSRAVALLDDLPGVHHRDPVARLGDDAEVVGDQQQRGVEVAPQVGEDAEDLRLDEHVERGRRLVGDDARFGRSTSASAIMIRCRMPPENSCGYCL